MRDSQRQKVYGAESVLHAFCERHETVSEIETLVRKVRKNAYLNRRYKSALSYDIRVEDGRRRRAAGGNSHGIKMPKWSRCTHIVLHELAHTISSRTHRVSWLGRNKTTGIAAHGWEYCSVYLDLVRAVLGREAHDRLKASFKAERVKYKATKKRVLTDEQKQQLRERFKKALTAAAV